MLPGTPELSCCILSSDGEIGQQMSQQQQQQQHDSVETFRQSYVSSGTLILIK